MLGQRCLLADNLYKVAEHAKHCFVTDTEDLSGEQQVLCRAALRAHNVASRRTLNRRQLSASLIANPLSDLNSKWSQRMKSSGASVVRTPIEHSCDSEAVLNHWTSAIITSNHRFLDITTSADFVKTNTKIELGQTSKNRTRTTPCGVQILERMVSAGDL